MAVQLLVNIDVDDLEGGIRFYRDALGLQLGRRLFGGTVAEMVGASSTVHLLVKSPGSPTSPETATVRDYRRHWTPVHLDVEVTDVAVAVARAVAAGARLEGDVRSFEWGRLATLSDPFGHGFCLLELIGGGYDAEA